MCGDGERQADVHAAAVALHRRVEEVLHFGEGDDLIELLPDLRAAHPEDRAVQKDVLAAGQFGVKAGADFEEAAEAAVELGPACGRPDHPRQQFQ